MIFLAISLLATTSLNQISPCAAADNIQYPTNSQEVEFIDSVTRQPLSEEYSSSLDLIKATAQSLRAHLEVLRASRSGHDQRHIELLEQYLKLAQIGEQNCSQQHADELVFLLHIHQHDPDGSAFRYIQETTTEQFKLCLPIWDRQFGAAIYSIDQSDRDKMERLLDQMMQIKFKHEDTPYKPYNKVQLRKLVANPPASAILLFMVSLDSREEKIPVDENLKNLTYKWDDFQKVYAEMVLSLCSKICDSLNPPSIVFKAAFDYNLDSSRFDHQVNHQRDLWMAAKMISCSIKRAHEKMDRTGEDIFMRSTFDKLTIQEEIMIENELGLDELIAFGQTLKED